MVDGEHELLAVSDVRGYVIVVGRKADRIEVAEVWIKPGDGRQLAPGGVLNEARRLWVDTALEPRLPAQDRMAEERELVAVAEAVVAVGETQGAGLEGVPAPRDAVGVQMPDKRRAVVDRRQVERQLVAAACRVTT